MDHRSLHAQLAFSIGFAVAHSCDLVWTAPPSADWTTLLARRLVDAAEPTL